MLCTPRYFHAYFSIMTCMSAIHDISVISASLMQLHPEAMVEVWRWVNLAHFWGYAGFSEAYSMDSLVLPLAECFGNFEHGMLHKDEVEAMRSLGEKFSPGDLTRICVSNAIDVVREMRRWSPDRVSSQDEVCLVEFICKLRSKVGRLGEIRGLEMSPVYAWAVIFCLFVTMVIEGTQVGGECGRTAHLGQTWSDGAGFPQGRAEICAPIIWHCLVVLFVSLLEVSARVIIRCHQIRCHHTLSSYVVIIRCHHTLSSHTCCHHTWCHHTGCLHTGCHKQTKNNRPRVVGRAHVSSYVYYVSPHLTIHTPSDHTRPYMHRPTCTVLHAPSYMHRPSRAVRPRYPTQVGAHLGQAWSDGAGFPALLAISACFLLVTMFALIAVLGVASEMNNPYWGTGSSGEEESLPNLS